MIKLLMIIKWIVALSLWILIGLMIYNQFNPNSIKGSIMGIAFIFLRLGVLVFTIFLRQKLKKK